MSTATLNPTATKAAGTHSKSATPTTGPLKTFRLNTGMFEQNDPSGALQEDGKPVVQRFEGTKKGREEGRNIVKTHQQLDKRFGSDMFTQIGGPTEDGMMLVGQEELQEQNKKQQDEIEELKAKLAAAEAEKSTGEKSKNQNR